MRFFPKRMRTKMTEDLDPSRIDGYREEIDRIDARLLEILNRRAACALSIGRIKKKNHMAIHVPEREQQVLDRLSAANSGPCTDESVRIVFQAIFDQMKVLEHEHEDDE